MPFPQAFLDELIDRNPIEDVVGQYVALTRRGSNLFGLCPFHSEKTASFSVAPDKQMYYCFGCHKGGGAINFIMDVENLEYPDAVRFLAKRAGMDVPEDAAYQSQLKKQERLWNLNKAAARYFHASLRSDAGRAGRAYIAKRGLSGQTVTRFGLGFAAEGFTNLVDEMHRQGYDDEDLLDAGLATRSRKNGKVYDRFHNRLMFPIIDVRGHVIGFGGRVMDDGEPKYLNSPETVIFNKRKNLFALNVAKKTKMGKIILTEGYMDAISLHQYGFDCAVASLGTALTEEQALLLSKYTDQLVLIYDGDEAGQNATKRAIGILEKTGMQVKVLRMRGAKDPDEFLKKYGADRFRVLLEESENHVEYQLQSLQRKYDLKEDEQRVQFLQEAAQLVASLPSAVAREVYGGRAAQTAGITPEAMKLEVNKAFRRRDAQARRQQEKKDLAPVAALQPKDRAMQYQNVRSAMAEEGVLRQVLTEPALFDQLTGLSEEMFSSPLLGRAFSALRACHEAGGSVLLAAVAEQFTPEEMNHLAAVANRQSEKVNEAALRDYLETIRTEFQLRDTHSADDLLVMQQRLKARKGYGGANG